MSSILKHLAVGLVLRLGFLLYGLYQDSASVVKYTDIDYSVYSDAAKYVVDGKSPYLRETYRYTPILAWILTPNSVLLASYGKIVFLLFDLLTSYLIYLIVRHETRPSDIWSVSCSYLWIYNPLPIVICTRGSSESIILCIVLAVLYFFHVEAYVLTGLFYGFSVHFKPYTLPHILPLYLSLGPAQSSWKSIFYLTSSRLKLILGSAVGFALPTAICYYFYGQEFLQETYFYHATRKDIKHNFSLYFYLLYLNSENNSLFLKLVSFLPQIVLLSTVAILFPSKKHASFCIFVQTYCFVIFNKVCTSQYFLWYLSILPVLIPKLKIKWTHAAILLVVWYFAQFAWLLPAYYLEFEGRNTFMYVWLESIAFFCANIGILVQIIKSYHKSTL
ncbi:unnamed protein product [Allacma fusca]|uniref:GPI alpha-1,4-mannosyltransferase I, catalytic subunit n=1 Tax=Allacma fusca TaxID=39272 RepID=A0A8J2PNW3_9HEXA|nr:unnamed protein product [Allacma fusca]